MTGQFRALFDRCSDRVKKAFIKDYEPPNWQEKARQAVIEKLEGSLKSMMPWYAGSSRAFAETLLSNITHQLSTQQGITWDRALGLQLELTRSSPRELAMSNAVQVLIDLNRINHPEIEKNIIESIGRQGLDLESLNPGNVDTLKKSFATEIAKHLESHYQLEKEAAAFGGKAIAETMFTYDLDLESAKELLHIPAALRQQNKNQKEVDQHIKKFVRTGIGKTLHKKLGLDIQSANNIAPAVDFCMRRYHLDLIQALDLASLAQTLTVTKQESAKSDATTISQASNDRPKLNLNDMDKARAIQQVMARDQCDFSAAREVIERRIKALPEIMRKLPPNTVPSIVNGFQFNIHSSMRDTSKEYLREEIKSLKNLPRQSWQPRQSSKSVDLPSVYLQDAIRTLRVSLHENGKTRYFDSRGAHDLTDSIYEFAGDDPTMQAICDSVNQAIKASILKAIVKIEQSPVGAGQLMLHPGDNPQGIQGQLSWNTVTKDGRGNLIVRHLFLQKHAGIVPLSLPVDLPMNQGDHWKGDVSPANAGLMFDVSYVFKLSDLEKGIRDPKILDSHYSIRGSLDWDTIDPMLASPPPG